MDIVMGMIVRTGFWFSLVLLALPLGAALPNGERAAGPVETFLAAREAFDDLSGICVRKPGVCETGKLAVDTVGVRAKEAARVAYQVLDKQFGASDKTAVTGGIEQLIEQSASAK